jgi:two-component system, OmpR family, sensor kinase
MRMGRLALKIYVYSVVVAILATVGMFVAAVSTIKSERWEDFIAGSGHMVRNLWQYQADPEALREATRRAKRFSTALVTLYDAEGRLVASTADPPLPMPSRTQIGEASQEGFVEVGHGLVAHQVESGGRVVAVGIVKLRFPSHDRLFRSLPVLLGILLVVAVIFARRLAGPLQHVANVARRFGQGDLGARVSSRRSDEIGEVGLAFDAMADRVTGLMAAQQELMANVSHELRTPLARIQVAVDLMTDGKSEEAKDLVPDIAIDLDEVERLLDDVMTVAKLDLSRSQAATSVVPLRLETLAIDAVIREAASRFRSLHHTHTLVVEVAPGLPEMSADAVLLRRVVDNLLDNARKFSGPGTTIRLSAHPAGAGAVVTISDRGTGIEQDDLPHVFTPFFRCDRSRSRSTGGVGLGLALAKRVVEAHGGGIEMTSTPGEGTTVTLELPARPAAA